MKPYIKFPFGFYITSLNADRYYHNHRDFYLSTPLTYLYRNHKPIFLIKVLNLWVHYNYLYPTWGFGICQILGHRHLFYISWQEFQFLFIRWWKSSDYDA